MEGGKHPQEVSDETNEQILKAQEEQSQLDRKVGGAPLGD